MTTTTRTASGASIAKVRAGDLITVDFMNGIIDWLSDHETRITALEAAGTVITHPAVTITSIVGTGTPIRVGMRLTVNGTNFMQPASLNAVTVGGVVIASSAFGFDSSDAVLSFDVPNVPGLAAAGSSLPVVVSNANGSASMNATILPALVIPAGRVEVTYTAAPLGTIAAAQSFTFTYDVNAIVDQAATYNIVPSVTGVTGWTATLLEDASDVARVSSANITITANTRKTLRVRVTIPNGATGAGTLRVDVTSAVAGTNIQPGSSSPIVLTIGSPAPVPDNRVIISPNTTLPIQNGRVMITRGSTVGVAFNLSFTEAATYTIAPTLRNPSGWSAVAASPASFAGAPGANSRTTVALSPAVGAVETDLILVVTGTNGFRGEYDLPLGISG